MMRRKDERYIGTSKYQRRIRFFLSLRPLIDLTLLLFGIPVRTAVAVRKLTFK